MRVMAPQDPVQAETSRQSGGSCSAEAVVERPQAAEEVRQEENLQEQPWWAKEPFHGGVLSLN